MTKVSESIINALSTDKDTKVLSIYMPTHHISTTATLKEDQTRLKTLLKNAFEQWQNAEPDIDINDVEQKLNSLLSTEKVWEHTHKSLALFISSRDIKIVHLPIEVTEFIRVHTAFDVTPLRLAHQFNWEYYLLTLALHDSKLFKGDGYGLEPIEIGFPTSPEDALNIDEMFSGSHTVRGVSTPGGGNDTLSSHGQGDSNHAGQEERLKYLRIIDHLINTSKEINDTTPLIVAATDKEANDFLALSNYPTLLPTFIAGNHTMTPSAELHTMSDDKAYNELVLTKISNTITTFNDYKGMQKGSSDVSEIIEAATIGKVDTLLIGILDNTYDTVEDKNEGKNYLIRLDDTYEHMHEVIDAVLSQGGKIVGVDNDQLESPSRLAAIYRY